MAKKKPAAKKQNPASVPVEALRHVSDTRPNIPTRETAAFAPDDGIGQAIYHRHRSLDPQLVWKGKDEQDAKPLEVPAVPIHVQEKIHPQAIVEAVKSWSRSRQDRPVLDLFSDFNGLDDFAQKLEFYQHDQHWTNRLILGDSLLVMASLAEKERLRGQVQCIYFDPPYGIKFGSNWQVSTRKREVKDAKAEDLTRQPEQIKAFRDTWELGIHSYLTYMRDRLAVARDLLTESGSIFVQIGEENVHLVRSLLDEVFGSECFVAQIVYVKTTGATAVLLPGTTDYILWYAKKIESVKYRQLFQEKVLGEEGATKYDQVEMPDGVRRSLTKAERDTGTFVGRPYTLGGMTSQSAGREKGEGAACWFAVQFAGKEFRPDSQSRWKTNEVGMKRLLVSKRLQVMGNSLRYVRFIDDFPAYPITNTWVDIGGIQSRSDPKIYVVQTSTTATERCLLMTTDPGDLVLDPTCGSGTTAYVAEQWGRRWITVDTSRVALALARTRLMAARFPYYLLADSPEGRKKQSELTATLPDPAAPPPRRDLHQGFVYRTVPHVTLKSIANNPDIHEGMTRDQIDRAIARHADSETLYDQPYEDKSIVRLTGPFTVESLSPHRSLPTGGWGTVDGGLGETEEDGGSGVGDGAKPHGPSSPIHSSPSTIHHPTIHRSPSTFSSMILDNLRKAGVKGTNKAQRITLARLDPFPGENIHAEGETDSGSTVRVCVGPEFGTIGDADIKKAALEAIKGSGCDLLLVCAFAFEPSIHEQTAELTKEIKFGKLTILPVRMNPDLAMGDELLKKTGAGNLFTVFGEPDVVVDWGEWMVDNRGRRVMGYERAKRLSGLGSVEEINRAGGKDPSYFRRLSEGGTLRADVADAEGGGVGGGQHRGGGGEEQHGGVHPVPGDRPGIGGGGGDPDRAGPGVRLPEPGGRRAAPRRRPGHPQDALLPDEVAALQALTPADLPLSTIHSVQVTIRGVDVFDPSTGAVRSGDTDDIACWFLDTDYDGQSFFVRHAYFLYGGKDTKDGPYDKLKKALRAEIDESEWSKLYRATSQPFDPPTSGKIAVKVINHFGDEVLKVYPVPPAK